MNTKTNGYVIDASVAIKLVLIETYSDIAREFLNRHFRESVTTFHVPDIFYPECANILWKYVKRFNLLPAHADDYLEFICKLDFQTIETKPFISAALKLAKRYDISVYDACYVATAKKINVPLLTADERMINNIGKKEMILPLSSVLHAN